MAKWRKSEDSYVEKQPVAKILRLRYFLSCLKILRKCPLCSEGAKRPCRPRQEKNSSLLGAFRYLCDVKKRYRIVAAPLTLKPVATSQGSEISISGQTVNQQLRYLRDRDYSEFAKMATSEFISQLIRELCIINYSACYVQLTCQLPGLFYALGC